MSKIFDISKVNFDLLHREFAKSERKACDVQDLFEKQSNLR
jgi:type I restriction enzyme, R subunit